ncbi:Ulp1 protease family, C-terminal catalytic domain [Musa troglodytarum]|uniref:Ulp1 protease family, C-terminal catalytic domain n=1 Tax=Musa troglodytarum TaxID=320322 RepID=A0A9E7KMJ0_9LILI|nr:Ulp1 protease family, C-terminal catalytic domain [Musa troglodytarum]
MAPPKNKGDEKILSYLDVVMRRSNLDILRGPHYLNDRIIEFYFAHLASLSPSPRALVLPPSISFWLTNCPDPQSLHQSTDPLRLPDRDLILFPVNSNLDVTVAGGGSQWSLLVYCREAGEFLHHDSCRSANRCHAERLFNAVSGFVDDGSEPPRFVEGFTPQQTNGHDCRRTLSSSGFTHWRRSAAVCRCSSLSKMVPPIFVPYMWSYVKPL